MAREKLECSPFYACTVPLTLVPGEEAVYLVLNKLSIEYKVLKKTDLGRADQGRIVEVGEHEALIYDPESEIYGVVDKAEFALPQNAGLIDVSSTHIMVWFYQRTGLSGPGGKGEKIDGKPNLLKTRVAAAIRETLEETIFELAGHEIIPEIHFLEKPYSSNSYFTIAFLLNAHNISYRKDQTILDPNIDPRYSKFYRLDSIPIESSINPESPRNEFRKEEDNERSVRGKRMGTVELAGTYHAFLRRLVGILIQLQQPILTELGRPDAENADDLVAMLLRKYHYNNIFSYRMLQVFSGMRRMDFVVNHILKSNGALKKRRLVEKMAANLVLLIEDAPLLDEALVEIRKRLAGGLVGDKAFAWMDFQNSGAPTRGSFDDFVAYRKLRKSKGYLRAADKKAEVDYPEEELLAAPEFGKYEEEEDSRPDYEKLWLPRESKKGAAH